MYGILRYIISLHFLCSADTLNELFTFQHTISKDLDFTKNFVKTYQQRLSNEDIMTKIMHLGMRTDTNAHIMIVAQLFRRRKHC
jgi:hypothetical protein